MGSAICGTGIAAPKTAFRFSTKKPAYLNTARQPRSNANARIRKTFLCLRSMSRPKPQLTATEAIIRSR